MANTSTRINIGIVVEPKLKHWLAEEAARQNRTVSNLIATICMAYKDANTKKRPVPNGQHHHDAVKSGDHP